MAFVDTGADLRLLARACDRLVVRGRALVTGASGTVGRALVATLTRAGVEVVAWDRSEVPIDVYQPMEDFVRRVAPDVVFHLAVASVPTGRDGEGWAVSYEWSSELAWVCRVVGPRFVFTSTALVFSNEAVGPFTVRSAPDAAEGYGFEKRSAEGRVLSQNPAALVVRLGWQIGDAPGGNNMLEFFERAMASEGVVRASRRWKPACAFVGDTADALWSLANPAAATAPGLYMIDANAADGWSFDEIARALSARHGDRWRIEATDDFVYDQRMIDERVSVVRLSERLQRRA